MGSVSPRKLTGSTQDLIMQMKAKAKAITEQLQKAIGDDSPIDSVALVLGEHPGFTTGDPGKMKGREFRQLTVGVRAMEVLSEEFESSESETRSADILRHFEELAKKLEILTDEKFQIVAAVPSMMVINDVGAETLIQGPVVAFSQDDVSDLGESGLDLNMSKVVVLDPERRTELLDSFKELASTVQQAAYEIKHDLNPQKADSQDGKKTQVSRARYSISDLINAMKAKHGPLDDVEQDFLLSLQGADDTHQAATRKLTQSLVKESVQADTVKRKRQRRKKTEVDKEKIAENRFRAPDAFVTSVVMAAA
jgi:hypothetical protein